MSQDVIMRATMRIHFTHFIYQPFVVKLNISPLILLVTICIVLDVPGAGLTTVGERGTTSTTMTSGGVIIAGTPSPYIEPFKLNTTAFAGQTAYLPCVVKHLGDKTKYILCNLYSFDRALSNVAFVAKEMKDKNYIRPRINHRMIFLLESLTLAFPQSVLQLCLLMEDYKDFPSVRGVIMGIGIFGLTLGITFARIRFDSAKRYDRYGVGLDKWIRYSVLWSSKVLWIITYCCVIVSVRIMYGPEYIISPIVAIVILLVLFEVPVVISSVRSCQRFAAACLSIFFLLPQFMALIALIFWVNVDTTIYDYNIGSCILGMFFWVESMCIMGWLLDRCTGRDIDFISGYPHFFGNLFTNCCK